MAYIYGTSASETLTGTTGDDTIYGNGGNDVILGGAGNDQLYASEGSDRLEGGEGADSLYGGGGDDTLFGGDGNDTLLGNYGADTIDGGAGADRLFIEFDGYADVLTGGGGGDNFEAYLPTYISGYSLNVRDRITDFSVAEGDTLSLGVSNGRLGGYGDYLLWFGAITSSTFSLSKGAALPDAPDRGFVSVSTWTNGGVTYLIFDLDSNGVLGDADFVLDFGGAPTLSKGDLGAGVFKAIVGTTAADTWSGGAAADLYFGFAGDDVISGGGGDDTLDGDAGDDILNGQDGADTLIGGEGSDNLNGDVGDDILNGGYGSDTLNGGAGNDTLYAGGAGYDGFGDSLGSVNKLYGGDGDDVLYASTGKDVLEGGAGNDTLAADTNDIPGDVFNGGDGDDQLRTNNATLDGGAGADKIWLGGGNTIIGGSGADTFIGHRHYGAGWSDYGVSVVQDFNAADGDRFDIGQVTDFRSGSLVFRGAVTGAGFSAAKGQKYGVDDLGAEFQQVWTWATSGGTYVFVDFDSDGAVSIADLVVKVTSSATIDASSFLSGYFSGGLGTSGADTFTGAADADIYAGAGGDDTIRGSGGADVLSGNLGNDQIWGDAGDDYILGGDGADEIYGGDGADYISAGLGSDIIHGGGGSDQLYVGNDYNPGVANDVDIAYGDDGDDRIVGSSAWRGEVHGGAGNDQIYGAGELYGDAGNDSISVGNYGGVAYGGDGDDDLWTGGASTLYGDAGSDSFYGSYYADTLYVELGDNYAIAAEGDDRIYLGGLRTGETQRLYNLSAGGGDDTVTIQVVLNGTAAQRIAGDLGFDTLDLSPAKGAVTVDLSVTQSQDTGMGAVVLSSFEAVRGGDFGAVLKGDANANRLTGGASADNLSGGGGVDVLMGGGGDDVLDGGIGVDVAQYDAASTNYSWTSAADGAVTVKDLRAGAPEGSDSLKGVEVLRFSDRSIILSPIAVPASNETLFASILRTSVTSAIEKGPFGDLALSMTSAATVSELLQPMIRAAGATTSVATLAYEFFTGKIPSQAGVDYLVSPTGPNANNLNSAYYQSFNLENRYINFAVNLGKQGEGKDAFLAKYGALSFVEATREAYKTIFGGAPTDEKIHAMIDTRVDYFATYGGDGVNGIGTKAAMVGWLLAEAQKADLGVMVRSNDAWLTDLADGSAPFAIDIIDPAKGYYSAYFVYSGG
jgi:Ca2+-binding RTX toxin-like protein